MLLISSRQSHQKPELPPSVLTHSAVMPSPNRHRRESLAYS
ncbi:hypothetical protein LINPERPRIM_LOCUS292 [Linum perenne]